MIKIILSLSLIVTQAFGASSLLDIRSGTSFPGISYEKNFVKNSEAEFNKNNVTDASSIVTRNTTTPLQGVASFGIDATGSAQLVKFDTGTLDNNLKGQNCEAKFVFTGDASLYKAYVEQGATKVTSDLQLTSETNSRDVSINFLCGDLSSNSHLVIESTSASAAAIKVDKVYLGKSTNLGQAMVITNWADYTPTFTGFGTVTLTYAKWRRVADSIELDIKFVSGTPTGATAAVSMPSGVIPDPFNGTTRYAGEFVRESTNEFTAGSMLINTANGNDLFFGNDKAVSSGAANPLSLALGNSLIGSGNSMVIRASFKVTGWSANSNAVSYDCVGSANCQNVFSATVSSAGVVSNENFDWISGNCTNANPLVCTYQTSLFSAAPSCVAIATSGRIVNITASSASSISIEGVSDLGVATQYGFQIVCSRQASDIKPQVNVPLLVGSVSSNTTGMERVERAQIASGCTTITRQSGSWLSSVSSSGTGFCQLNFATGIFSGIPTCVANASSPQVVGVNNLSSSLFEFKIIKPSTEAATNDALFVTCMGPR